MKKYIAIDAINGEQEVFKTIEAAREWLTGIILEDNEIHPDAESCSIHTITEIVSVERTDNGFYEVKFVPYE